MHLILFKTSQKTTVVVELPVGAQERNAFDPLLWVEFQSGLKGRRVQCTALGRRP